MRFPIYETNKPKQYVVNTFYGYNHNPKIKSGEFYDMLNLTSDSFPLMSTRKPRAIKSKWSPENLPTGIANRNGKTFEALGNVLRVYNTEHPGPAPEIDLGLSVEKKDMIFMGSYLIIMPDKKYINTTYIGDHGDIEALYQTADAVKFEPCKSDGTVMTAATVDATAPADPKDGQLWVDTSREKHVWKEWSVEQKIWVSIAKVYVKISAAGVGLKFKEGDGIRIELGEVTDPQLKDLEGNFVIQSKGDDWIVVIGIIDTEKTWSSGMDIAREMPIMDYIVESGNRLWGCRYGKNRAGDFVNEIYCSKLGDFKNWQVFNGVSTDSYVVSLGSDGPFTGAVTYRGMPHFFKADHLHIVTGKTLPFPVKDVDCRGVQPGCSKSLDIVNEILYYKSWNGFCAFDGSLPTTISDALGQIKYEGVRAEHVGDKYYAVCYIPNPKGFIFPSTPELLVFDTAKGLWHKEDNIPAHLIYSTPDDIIIVDKKGNEVSVNGKGTEQEMPWMAETGIIGAYDMRHTYLQKLRIRFAAEAGSKLTVSIQYDSVGEWEDVGTVVAQKLEPVSFPIIPRRCDHLRIRLKGTGPIKIYAISRDMKGGSTHDYP